MVILKDINLMPRGLAVRRENMRLLKVIFKGVAIAAAVAILMDLTVGIFYFTNSNKIKEQEYQKSVKLGFKNDTEVFEAAKNKDKYKQDIIYKVDNDSLKVTKLVNNIENLTPLDISINTLSIDNSGYVKLSGVGAKVESILDFYNAIKKSELTDYVDFKGINGNLQDTKNLNFDFSFKLKGRK